jgi:hypothetical protein
MVKLERVDAYSNPSLSKPDLRITLGLLKGPRISIRFRRIRGNGDVPRECWLSQVDFLILQSIYIRLDAELVRADQLSPDHLPMKLILTAGGYEVDLAPASKAPRWLRLVSQPGSPPSPPHRGRSGHEGRTQGPSLRR